MPASTPSTHAIARIHQDGKEHEIALFLHPDNAQVILAALVWGARGSSEARGVIVTPAGDILASDSTPF